MIRMNENYNRLQGSYLFAEIAKRVAAYQSANPESEIIRLGIGDVTEPLAPSIIQGLHEAVNDMSRRQTFKGYRSDEGYEFLREVILKTDFLSHGVELSIDEIVVTCGAKEDTANFQELFAQDVKIALPDPVYTVYVESNVMAGRGGEFADGRYKDFVYLDCTAANSFLPDLPQTPVDLIYLCFPNNPTGQAADKETLKTWVDYALKNRALILFDAAYEAFIREDGVPHSIFEIEGAKECAVEFRSLSKTAGFTGTRLGYTIIPKEAKVWDSKGQAQSLLSLWNRRQSTKYNGTAYIIQRGAYEVFTDSGQRECKATVDYYLGNARIIRQGLESVGLDCAGALNSPYVWAKTPRKLTSWEFFDLLLNKVQVVGTPGSGFGRCGEGYFRFSSFGSRENVMEAVERIKKLEI